MELEINGVPFEDLDEKAKKLFQACQDLTFQTSEDLDEKAKNLLQICQYLNQQTFEGLNEKAKKLLEACQDPDHNSIQDLDGETLMKKDNNGMTIFHVLLFDAGNEWYTKNLNTALKQKVVAFIEAISQKLSKQDIESMMVHQDILKRTPLHYAGFLDVVDEKEDSNITLALMKHGADKALFMEDGNEQTPVSFIDPSNLKVHLDRKQTNQGPAGYKNRVAHFDVSVLQPAPDSTDLSRKTRYPWNLQHLEKLGNKHLDLFDHQVISAMIW